jgi:hypothetical protein
MSSRRLFIISLFPLFVYGVFEWHNYQLNKYQIEFADRDKKTMKMFHYEYDSFVSQLYIHDPEYAITFEDIFDKSYVLPWADTIIQTLFFKDKVTYINYNKTYFNCLKNIAEIEIENIRNELEAIDIIINISDKFGDYGDEWRPKMLNEEFKRFFSIAYITPTDCNDAIFKTKKIIKKTSGIIGYMRFLTDYKSKVESQDDENTQILGDLNFLVELAKSLGNNLYNELQGSQLLEVDTISVVHKFEDSHWGEINFTTKKFNVDIEGIKSFIFKENP